MKKLKNVKKKLMEEINVNQMNITVKKQKNVKEKKDVIQVKFLMNNQKNAHHLNHKVLELKNVKQMNIIVKKQKNLNMS